MVAQFIIAIILWIFGTLFSLVGLAEEEPSLSFVGGLVVMLALWESWVLYKFYMLPLGL